MTDPEFEITLARVPANGININVATAGSGPAVLLLHGFPHTWQVWRPVLPALTRHHRVLAPDLRGLGASTRAESGYDGVTLATDFVALLDALEVPEAAVAGLDAGAPPAFLLAMRAPHRVRRLVLMESLLGTLPGAGDFLAGGAPWWFGFHGVPGLAERAVAGNEDAYLGWFLDAGTRGRGVPEEIRSAFMAAYSGIESLRCAFSYYRALPQTARQIAEATAGQRLTVPTLAVGAQPIGPALAQQLHSVCDDLTTRVIEDCGHIIPLDRPDLLLPLLDNFLRGTAAEGEPAGGCRAGE